MGKQSKPEIRACWWSRIHYGLRACQSKVYNLAYLAAYGVVAGAQNGLYGITALAADNIWAVGFAGGTLTLHWDGSAWTIVPSPSSGSGNILKSVSAIASDDIWAVGSTTAGNPVARTLVEHWDGTQWSIAPSPNVGAGNNYLSGVVAISANNVWAVGTYVPGYVSDVAADNPFYAQIETAYHYNIISGYSCGGGCLEFRPGNNATRGQITKIVYLAITQPWKKTARTLAW